MMNNFLDELNENLNKVLQKKFKENKHVITISELFTGVKEYMDIGEYFERFCNNYNTGWKLTKLNDETLDFDLTERRKEMTELDKLEQYLKEHNYIYTRHPDQIEVFKNEERKELGGNYDREWDAICNEGSLGYEEGLLEVMDRGHQYFLEEDYWNNVLGYLTAEDIINFLEKGTNNEHCN